MASRTARLALLTISTFIVIALTAGVAFAATPLNDLLQVNSASDDMGSTAREISGATYNPTRNVLLTVDDEQNAYEFQLDGQGFIDGSVTPRIIDLDLGTDDFEGIAWVEGEKYAFLSERSGEVILATVPAAQANQRTTVEVDDVERSFPVISGNWGNLGPEGLATDGEHFYVVREFPATVTQFEFDGTQVASISLSSDLADASGIVVLADGTFVVTSHENRLIAHYEFNWNTAMKTLLATSRFNEFSQLEGIAAVGSDLHLFGEDNTRNGIGGQTYSHLQSQASTIDPPQYEIADVNCSGTTTVADALRIAQINTQLVEPIDGCGSGDLNGDGLVSLIDAIWVSQCQVGIPNAYCPDAI